MAQARERLTLLPDQSCNGYWHGKPGLDQIEDTAASPPDAYFSRGFPMVMSPTSPAFCIARPRRCRVARLPAYPGSFLLVTALNKVLAPAAACCAPVPAGQETAHPCARCQVDVRLHLHRHAFCRLQKQDSTDLTIMPTPRTSKSAWPVAKKTRIPCSSTAVCPWKAIPSWAQGRKNAPDALDRPVFDPAAVDA